MPGSSTRVIVNMPQAELMAADNAVIALRERNPRATPAEVTEAAALAALAERERRLGTEETPPSVIFALGRASNGGVIPEPAPVSDAIEYGPKFEGTNWAIEIADLQDLLKFTERVGAIEITPSVDGTPHILICDDYR